MLKNYIDLYSKKNLLITPILKSKKAPFLPNWQKGEHTDEELLEKYGEHDFAIITGELSNIIVLDLDLTNEEYQKLVLPILEKYPTPIKRIGSKKKLPSMFYKYTKFQYNKINIDKDNGIEILSDGRCCVLPPSIHPEGHEFYFVKHDLLNFDLEYLPEFNPDLFLELQNVFSKFNTNNTNYGRHLKLIDIASASIEANEPFSTIVNSIIDYDKKRHIPPYLTDKSENHKHNPYAIASHMVASVLKTHCSKGKTYNPESLQAQININEISQKLEEKFSRKKLPHLRGFGAEIFNYIYENSDVKRASFAFASTLAVVSTVIGNKISWLDIHPNLYIMLIANSGSGKDWYLKAPSNIFEDCNLRKLKGEGQPSSDTGIIMSLPTKRVRLDTVDEASNLFNSINSSNSYASKMRDVYAQLYTSGGKYFDGKNIYIAKKDKNTEGNIGGCFSPYVSFIGAMTFEGFSESFNDKIMATGLGGRFLYFSDNRFRKSVFRIKNKNKTTQAIKDFMKIWGELASNQPDVYDAEGFINLETAKESFQIPIARSTNNALRELESVHNEIEVLKLKYNNTKLSPIVNRMYENVIRLSIIDAVLMQFNLNASTNVEIEKESVLWAKEVVFIMFHNTSDFIENNLAGSSYENNLLRVKSFFDSKNEAVSKSQFTNRFQRIEPKLRSQILNDLIDGEIIFRVNKDNQIYDSSRDTALRSIYYSANPIIIQ